MRTEYTISGFLVGPIWMPATECWKDLHYTFVRADKDRASPWQDARDDLRDAVSAVTNDGDFQYCKIAHGILIVNIIDEKRRIKRWRNIPLSEFPSVADMVMADWDGPYSDED